MHIEFGEGGAVMKNESKIEIVTEWDIVTARQLGRNEAKTIGFGTVDQARITTAISELARNIYLFAKAGEIIIERVEEETRQGIVITAVDKGPGIEDIRRVMEDGFTTSGGLGSGLPGVKRLMDHMDIQSSLGKGTTVRIEKWLKAGSESL